jgi:hypothetical protein
MLAERISAKAAKSEDQYGSNPASDEAPGNRQDLVQLLNVVFGEWNVQP